MGGKRSPRPIDGLIAALAERQHGVVARSQLAEIGLGDQAIDHRLRCGRLHPLHRGVFAVGHRKLTAEGRWMAAVLAGGADAVLSHRTAAALWGIRPTASSRIEITVPRKLRSRPGTQAHRTRLAQDEITTTQGIPVTTPPRTLLDLATVLTPPQLSRALDEAEILRLTDALSLGELLDRYRGHRGVAKLKRIVATATPPAKTRGELEERFIAFLHAAHLPRPELNAPIELQTGWIEADCVWRSQRLIVELDGYATHGIRSAFERDRARDRALQAAGWRVVRITWRHLHDQRDALTSALRALLGSVAEDRRRLVAQPLQHRGGSGDLGVGDEGGLVDMS